MLLEAVGLFVLLLTVFLIGLLFVWRKRPLPISLKRFGLAWMPLFAVFLAAAFAFTNLLPASAQSGGDNIVVEKTFSGGGTYLQVQSGEVFDYEIRYSCALVSSNTNCDDATITDDLPPELEFVSFAPAPGTSMNYDPGLHRVTITFPNGVGPGQDGLRAGDTGLVVFRVRFTPGTLGSVTADNSADISAVISSTLTLTDTSDVITAETLPGTFQMTAQKSHQNTSQAGVIDVPPALTFQTVYDINVCGPTDIGGVNLLNAIITDTLPAEASFFSAADGGVYDAATHSVVWGPMTITVGACFNTSVTVHFDPDGPDGIPATGDEPVAGNTVVNNIVVTGDPEDGSPSVTLSGSDSLTLSLPSYASSLSKTSSSPSSYTGRPTEELAGGPVTYDMSIDNTGTVTLTNVILTDTVPVSHTVTSIDIGPSVDPVNVYYQDSGDPATWVAFPGNPYAAATSVPVTSLGLNAGEYITALRW
ncbi:MAG TPA: hypothetical protein ENJ93_07485, partial [Chloroflexi bacterium]|nr:hypothetical protein [Chloroflexota bacterium]